MHTLEALQAGHLHHITRLKIAEGLKEFPREIFQLAETLEILDLSDNQLSQLPEDFGQLKQLKVVFLSHNEFESLPAVLADCPKLTMIGFKANKISHVPENSLPRSTRWLILTDNQIASLPDSIGELTGLQKFMLAGNKVSELPGSMVNCQSLELFRVSANQLHTLPSWLLSLPKLSWLAFAGNPLTIESTIDNLNIPVLTDDDLVIEELLGAGASGHIHRATLNNQVNSSEVAIKLFKGEVTSDGYPRDEMHASLATGKHENLVEISARYEHAEQQGLIMALIPKSFTNLGYPPNFDTCTRDTFDDDFVLSIRDITKVSKQIIDVLQHLHSRKLNHGDLYTHNLLINDQKHVLLTDFGAASLCEMLQDQQISSIERIEVRAFGCLLEDLLTHCSKDSSESPEFSSLSKLKNSCQQDTVSARPSFTELGLEIDAIALHSLQMETQEQCAVA